MKPAAGKVTAKYNEITCKGTKSAATCYKIPIFFLDKFLLNSFLNKMKTDEYSLIDPTDSL